MLPESTFGMSILARFLDSSILGVSKDKIFHIRLHIVNDFLALFNISSVSDLFDPVRRFEECFVTPHLV